MVAANSPPSKTDEGRNDTEEKASLHSQGLLHMKDDILILLHLGREDVGELTVRAGQGDISSAARSLTSGTI